MSRPILRAVFLPVVLTAGLLLAPAASAAVVPVDPGPTGAGRPIWGTTQNLPPLLVTQNLFVGPANAAATSQYYQSGAALRDQRAITDRAGRWIDSWIKKHCDGKPKTCKAMVVFDVDDTLLSSFGLYAGLQPPFAFDSAAWTANSVDCGSPAIAPSVRLFNALKKKGIAIAVITGRDEPLRQATEDCLNKRGVSGWTVLHLRTAAQADLLASDYKAEVRASLEREGYTIVASIGDQVSDMAKGHLKAGFLLPNVMYFIP